MRITKTTKVAQVNVIDLHVGGRVRALRKALKISQSSLSQHLDVTFQQVQKYERGSNRISASKLYEIAQVLQVPVGFFFEGIFIQPVEGKQPNQSIDAFLHSDEGFALGEAFLHIPSEKQRKGMIDLMKALATAG